MMQPDLEPYVASQWGMFGRLVWPAVLTTLKHLNLKKTMLAFCCSGHRIISQIMSRDFAAQVFFLQTVSMELGGNFRQTLLVGISCLIKNPIKSLYTFRVCQWPSILRVVMIRDLKALGPWASSQEWQTWPFGWGRLAIQWNHFRSVNWTNLQQSV